MGVLQRVVIIGPIWPFQTISFGRELGTTDLLHLANFPVLFPVVAVTRTAHKPQRAWKVDSEKGAAVAGSVTSTVVVWHQQSIAVKLFYFPFSALQLARAKQQNLKQKTQIFLAYFPHPLTALKVTAEIMRG